MKSRAIISFKKGANNCFLLFCVFMFLQLACYFYKELLVIKKNRIELTLCKYFSLKGSEI